MAALMGDLYQMNNQSKGSSKPIVPMVNGLREETSDEIEQVSAKQNTSTGNEVSGLDQETMANNDSIESTMAEVQNMVRQWRGQDYQFDETDAKVIRALVSNSDNPKEAVSRYIAASGMCQYFPDLTIDYAYSNFDEISKYWTGREYDTKNVDVVTKVTNGFKRIGLMRDKHTWMQYDLSGDYEKRDALGKEIEEKEKALGELSSSIPTNLWDRITTAVLGNIGYIAIPTMKGTETGMMATMAMAPGVAAVTAANPIAGASVAGIAGLFATFTGALASGKEMREYATGESYWNMMHSNEGYTKNKANAHILSHMNGIATQLVETLIDGVTADVGKGIAGKLFGKEASTIGFKTLLNLEKQGAMTSAADAVMRIFAEGLDEGLLNEIPEGIAEKVTTALYDASIGVPVSIDMQKEIRDIINEGFEGAIVGMVYGGTGEVASYAKNKIIGRNVDPTYNTIKNNLKESIELRKTAIQSESWTEYLEKSKEIEKPSNVSKEDWDNAKVRIFNTSQQFREEVLGGTVLESAEIAQEELYSTIDEEGNEMSQALPDGSVKRDMDNNLESEVSREHDGSYTIAFGDKDSGAVYGTVSLDTNGTDITVKGVRVRNGYEGIRSEMVLDAIESIQSTESNVNWVPTTKGLQSVKQSLIDNNPSGKEAGLNYDMKKYNASNKDIRQLANEIKINAPNLTDGEALLTARLYTISDRGQTLTAVNQGQRIDSVNNLTPEQLQGTNIRDIRGATSKAKALIYAGQNSNFSTFQHELFHAVTAQRKTESMALSKAISETIKNDVDSEHFKGFVADHLEIWGKNANLDDIMNSLKSIDENASTWTIAQEENLANLYEAYRSSKKSQLDNLPAGIRTILEKIAEIMDKVYPTLRDNIALNHNIAKAYDNLMGFGDIESEKVKNGSNTESNTDKLYFKKKTTVEVDGKTYANKQELISYLLKNRNYVSEGNIFIDSDRVPNPDNYEYGAKDAEYKDELRKYKREKIQAEKFSSLFPNLKIYLIKDPLDSNMLMITNGKNPDSIVNGLFLELKQSDSASEKSIQNLFKESFLQGDAVYLNIEKEGSTIANALRYINGTLKSTSGNKYDGFKILISASDGFEEYIISKKELIKSSFLGASGSNPHDNYNSIINSNIVKQSVKEGDLRFQKVQDKKLLEELDTGETIKAYRAMQVIDGKLYPPMAAKVDGKMVEPAEPGTWYRSDERPDLIKNGKFTLDKSGYEIDPKTGKKKSLTKIPAAYNPYWHTSLSPLNDQFSSAYKRPNIVTVEVEIPKSELTSGYKAEFAKDAVGLVDWHAGPVSSKLAKIGDPRKVILSRYCKVIRVVPDSEVAGIIAGKVNGKGISIPDNTITPSLLKELENLGVTIERTDEVEAYNSYINPDVRFKMIEEVANEEEALNLASEYSDNKIDEVLPEPTGYDYSMPDDWNPDIYMGEEIDNEIDFEHYLEETSPISEVKVKEMEETETPTNDKEIAYYNQLDMKFEDFVKANDPNVSYTGTEEEKDRQFIEAMNNPKTFRKYMGILGEVIMHDTPSINVVYDYELDDTYNRYTTVRTVDPFIDEKYRSGLQDRILKQITNPEVKRTSKYAVEGADFPKNGIDKLALKEISENARAYRNIFAILTGNKDMLPSTMIESERKLDIPGRDKLDLMSVNEFAKLASDIKRADLEYKIKNGTLKFGSDTDESDYKLIVDNIKTQTEEIKNLGDKNKALERDVKNLEDNLSIVEKKLSERDSIIDEAKTIVDEFGNILLERKDNPDVKKYGELQAKLNNLKEESDYQKRATAKGSRDRGKAIGAKNGTALWMNDLKVMYPELFKDEKGNILVWRDGNSQMNKQIRANIEKEIGNINNEMKDLKASILKSISRRLMVKSGEIDGALIKASKILKGAGEYISNEDKKALNDTIDKLSKENKKADRIMKKHDEFRKEYTNLKNRYKTAVNNIKKTKQKYEQQMKDYKAELKRTREEKRKLEAIRQEKMKIANAIMRPVNLNTIDYDTAAEAIMAIQSMIDPAFRRDWLYDLANNPGQSSSVADDMRAQEKTMKKLAKNMGEQYQENSATMTFDQAKKYFNSLTDAQRNDLMQYLDPSLIDRLTEQKKPLNDWTVNELRQLALQVEDLRRRGREILLAKKAFEKARVVEIQRAILDSLSSHIKDSNLPGSAERLKERQSKKNIVNGAVFATRRMQEIAQLLDGGYGSKGYAYRLLVDDKRYHQAKERTALENRVKPVKTLFSDEAMDQMIETVSVDLDGNVQTFTIDQLAYVYLSKRDESNRAAVAYGSLLSEEEKGTEINKNINPMTGTIEKEFLDVKNVIIDDQELQNTGDRRYEILWNRAKDELEARGLMDLVEAISNDFNNPDNTRRLNRACIETYNRPLDAREYYLSIHRTDLSGDSFENDMADSIFNLNTNSIARDPEKGFTIKRIEISPRHQKNIDLSLINNWQRAVADQEHLIEFASYIKTLRRVFSSNGEIIRAMNQAYGPALSREITEYIELVANPNQGARKTGLDAFVKNVRGKLGDAYLGWKLSGIILQAITSPMPSLSEIDPFHLIAAYGQIARSPIKTIEDIMDKSVFMRTRSMDIVIDEAKKRHSQWNASKGQKALNRFNEIGQIGLEAVDKYMVAGAWLAMYQKGLNENLKNGVDAATAESAAIKRADDFILRTQPVGDPTEIASMFRTKNELAKAFLQFQTSLNVIWNNMTANMAGFRKNKEWSKYIGTITGYVTAGLILGLVANGFDDDDTKDKARKMAYWSTTQIVGGVPVFGNLMDSVANTVITGERKYSNRGFTISPGFDKIGSALMDVSTGKWKKAIGEGAEAAGLFIGLPVSGAKQNYKAIFELNPGALLGR